MAVKAQFMVSVNEEDRDRLDALRIVLNEPRAEIGRRALSIALVIMEKQNEARLTRLRRVAKRYGYPAAGTYVRSLFDQARWRVGQPTLEALELEQRDVNV